jgi:hypothetical protein
MEQMLTKARIVLHMKKEEQEGRATRWQAAGRAVKSLRPGSVNGGQKSFLTKPF